MDFSDIAQFEIKIYENAFELLAEAKWLHKLGHYSRSYALAHLAFEESAKLEIMTFVSLNIIIGKKLNFEDIRKIFKSKLFLDHKTKLRMGFLRLPGYDFQTSVKTIDQLNKLKNKSLYTDLSADKMNKPSDFFNIENSKFMIGITEKTLTKIISQFGIKKQKDLSITLIKKHYEKLKLIFENKFSETTAFDESNCYIEKLEDIISKPELFNEYKNIIEENKDQF